MATTTTNTRITATALQGYLYTDYVSILKHHDDAPSDTPLTTVQDDLIEALQGMADMLKVFTDNDRGSDKAPDWLGKRLCNTIGKKLWSAGYHQHPQFTAWLAANTDNIAAKAAADKARADAAAKAKRDKIEADIRADERDKMVLDGWVKPDSDGAKAKPKAAAKKTKPKADDA